MNGSKKKDDDSDINVFDFLSKVHFDQKWISYLLLAIFIMFGFFLRFYHIDYPVIGYHNWKTTHYITESRNFAREGFFKEGFFVPMRDTTETTSESPTGAHPDTFPTISIVVGFFFKLFGESLFVARIINILFSVGSIVVFFFLIKELFSDERIALISSFLAAISPLYIFFSHNVQLVNPGLFFMLLGGYYYIRWIKEESSKNKFSKLYLSVSFVVLATLTKYPFGIISVPILFSFPYKQFFKNYRSWMKPLVISFLILMIFPTWLYYSEVYVRDTKYKIDEPGVDKGTGELSSLVDMGILAKGNFWQAIDSYVNDNYSLLGFVLMAFGITSLVFLIFKNEKTYIFGNIIISLIFLASLIFKRFGWVSEYTSRIVFIYVFTLTLWSLYFVVKNLLKDKISLEFIFMYGYMVGFVVFFFVIGFKMSGHNYHQFPIAPFVLMMIAFFMHFVSKNIASFVKNKSFKLPLYILIIAIFFFVPFSQGKNLLVQQKEAKERMYNVQFPGLDVAGYYIRDHGDENDVVIHSSGQSFGILWHAERRGIKPPKNLEDLKKAESQGADWVFVYQWPGGANGMQGFCVMKDIFGYECKEGKEEMFDYISDNYRLVQFGLIADTNGFYPMYGRINQQMPVFFLFKKGGSFNPSEIDAKLNSGVAKDWTYNTIHDGTINNYKLRVIDLE